MKLKNKNIQCNYITRRKASMNIPSKPLRRSKIKTNFFYKIKLKNKNIQYNYITRRKASMNILYKPFQYIRLIIMVLDNANICHKNTLFRIS